MEERPNIRQQPDDSETEQENLHQNLGENMDFEDSQDSVWTTQSASNTTFESHKQDPELDLDDAESGKYILFHFSMCE